VNHLYRDAADDSRVERHIVIVNNGISERNVLVTAISRGAELQSVAAAGQHAVGNGNVAGKPHDAIRVLALQADRIITSGNIAIGNGDVTAAGEIDAIRVRTNNRIANLKAANDQRVAFDRPERPAGRVFESYIFHPNVFADRKSTRLNSSHITI